MWDGTGGARVGLWPMSRLERAVEERLMVARRQSRTRSEYLEEARMFGTWFVERFGREATLADLTLESAGTYLATAIASAEVRGSPWADDTVDHHARQLRAFAGHAAIVAGLSANPLSGLLAAKRTKREDRTGDGLEDDEILAVLTAIDGSSLGDIVDRALFVLGYECGPRKSEFGPMALPDFRMARHDGQPIGWVVDVRHPAKAGKPRVLPLGARAEGVLRDLVGHRAAGALFPSRDGTPLSAERVGDRLAELGKRAGVRLNAQRLRRSASSWQATYGASSGHLDTVFGWQPDPADVKSGHYIKPTLTQLLIAHQTRLSPLDRLEDRVGPLPLG